MTVDMQFMYIAQVTISMTPHYEGAVMASGHLEN